MSSNLPATLLLILDGWGQAPAGPDNAISQANTENIDKLMKSAISTELKCSGEAVGLPAGYMGNSEVGHINIGAGRVVYQDMTRIDMAIEDESLAKNPALLKAINAAKENKSNLHFLGLLSEGGVHSHLDHLIALLKIAHKEGANSVVHAFMDGRDSAPDAGLPNIKRLIDELPSSASIGSICGRYFAMDRDKRWDRTEKGFKLLVNANGDNVTDVTMAIQESYDEGTSDEFIPPTVLGDYSGFKNGDAVFMFNFRADRMRQLAHALADEDFDEFERKNFPKLSAICSMTSYEANLNYPVAFKRAELINGLGETIAKNGLSQLRIAETEKYAHVTFFFNGGEEKSFENEARKIIPSPRDVATYDEKPEMSAVEVTDTLIEEWESGKHNFIVCNLANMDMVGHTGSVAASIKACETVDLCVGRIIKAVNNKNGIILVTADHGNAEQMKYPDGTPHTSHTTNPVALLLSGKPLEGKDIKLRSDGALGDIAPTILDLWNIKKPDEMAGKSLIENE